MLKRLAGLYKRLVLPAFDKRLPPATDLELELVEELRDQFHAIRHVVAGNATPAEAAWINHARRLSELVMNDDPREFLRWDVIGETMFISHSEFIRKELGYLTGLSDWSSRWREAIKESQAGHPPPYLFHPRSSGNLIHHAYHLAQFEEKTGWRVEQMDYILEFGGGYGSMCRLFHNLGFRGRYVIFDLPHFSALQQFYLKSIGLQIHSADTLSWADAGVICVSDLESLKILLRDAEEHNAMFIATWSLSESPMWLRQSVLPLITQFSAFLIAYQHSYGEVDNLQFFREWEGSTDKRVTWHDRQIEHLPGSNYLFGKRLTLSITP